MNPTNELYRNRNGTLSLRNIASGEVMHSSVGPREEATLLYIEQSRLESRLADGSAPALVLFDVGLGAGTNALAALQVAQRCPRGFHLVSFENDLSGFTLALENHADFPFYEGFVEASRELLEKRRWQSADGRIVWELHEGDFRELAHACPAPDLIYYDFYSPKVAAEFWRVEMFTFIRSLCPTDRPAALYTYSASTRVRVAFLVAGFFVGYGRSTGAKLETTVASTTLAALEKPLDARWMLRFQRSDDPLPTFWPEERREELFKTITTHPQFSQLS